ncbi:MAG TPA: hypothetical protein VFK02_31175, partial [Kofleriaceae bacterium]|nr:hypothetical protein [Kofleriaceae bacterium]
LCSLVAAAGLAVVAGPAGCAGSSEYVYTPDTANATAAGLPAARTPIPQERPQGAIEIVSYGVTDLRREDLQIPALHVRAIVTNDGDDAPWTIDTTQQLVEIPGEGQSRAMFVNSDVGTLPNVSIARHERRVLDFYFPLPDNMRTASRLPRFELLWQVTTPARTVASRTSFDRVDRQPEVAYATVGPAWPVWAGWGPYWWYDPFYPRAVFIHVHPRPIHGTGHVIVGRFGGHFRAGGSAHVATRRR